MQLTELRVSVASDGKLNIFALQVKKLKATLHQLRTNFMCQNVNEYRILRNITNKYNNF